MKHCRNCNYCRKDMVAEYLKGLDLYKCDIDGHIVEDPFWDKCEKYQRDTFIKDNPNSILFQIVQFCRKKCS